MVSDHKSGRLIRCTSLTCSGCWYSIGEDLWIEIFKKLPIESLCCSLCVCKRWRSLISSQSFIKLHHSSTYSTTPPNLKPYLRVNIVDECHDSFALYRPIGGDHIRHDVHFPFRFLDDPPLHSFTFVDSIKGVVCVSYSMGSAFDSNILWNPAIHKYIPLPRLPSPLNPETAMAQFPAAPFSCSAIGFGYASSKNEFKVVRIRIHYTWIGRRCKSPTPTCEVYSTREGLWRSVSTADTVLESWEFNYLLRENRSCFVNGTIHWLVSTRNPTVHSVLMFDCEREELTTTELPREINVKKEGVMMSRNPMILEYGGMLAVVLHTCSGLWNMDWGIEMWVMEEHGTVSTWKKLYRVVDSFMSDGFVVNSYQASLEKMAPYGPNQWNKLLLNGERYYQVMNDHVHEESVFLLDDHKARSYTKEEIVHISVPTEF